MFKAIIVFIMVARGTLDPVQPPQVTMAQAVYPNFETCQKSIPMHHMGSAKFLSAKYPGEDFRHKVGCLTEEQFEELKGQIEEIKFKYFRIA